MRERRLEGQWWLPERPEERVAGIVEYDGVGLRTDLALVVPRARGAHRVRPDLPGQQWHLHQLPGHGHRLRDGVPHRRPDVGLADRHRCRAHTEGVTRVMKPTDQIDRRRKPFQVDLSNAHPEALAVAKSLIKSNPNAFVLQAMSNGSVLIANNTQKGTAAWMT
jgi:hypothetical protein